MEKFAVCGFVSTYLTKHNTLCFKGMAKREMTHGYVRTFIHPFYHRSFVSVKRIPPVVSVGKMRNKIYKYDADKYSILNF